MLTGMVSRRKRGIAIVMVMLALLVLGTVAGGVVMVGTSHLNHAYASQDTLEAQYAARAAAWIKMAQVRSGDLDPLSKVTLPGTGASYTATVIAGPGPGTPPFPPPNTYYIEGVGTSAGGKVRRVGILARLSSSRWNHAIFGNNKVEMRSGSYTDSFNSDGGFADHSKASVGTNKPDHGVVIEDSDSVVIGWANSVGSDGKRKRKKDKDEVELDPKADAQGPPGSTESVTVFQKKGKSRAYNQFVTGAQEANMDPVVLPKALPAGGAGTILPGDTYPTVDVPGLIPPGAYQDLKMGPGEIAVLDVSKVAPGSTAEYVFSHGIELKGGTLTVLQPPAGKPVTVVVYIDSGDGSDDTAGLVMEGASLVNPVSKPVNLQFMVAGKGKLSLEGHDDAKHGATPTAYYVAYAPEARIEVLHGQIFGAIVADKVVLDGDDLTGKDNAPAVVHFDVTLLDDDENPPQFSVLSVRNY